MHRARARVLAFTLAAMTLASEASAAPRLTKAPKLETFVAADYPEEELARGRSATVVLAIAISESGEVKEVAVVESAGAAFDAAAVAAAKKFVFEPAEIDGKPGPVKITYRYLFEPKVAAPTSGKLRGVVVAKGTGAPLGKVTVELAGASPHTTTTGEDGTFAFDELPPGDVRIALSRADMTRQETQETIEAGRTLDARYTVELDARGEDAKDGDEDKDDLEVVVVAPRLVKQVASTQVSADEARRLPGTQGDVLKVVENLPGVARATAGSGQVVVWGAAPQDTRTYVGAVRIPMLYHFGGLRSVLHNDAVEAVQLMPGGYGVAWGRGLGGLVHVALRDLPRDRLHGGAQLDLLDASAAVSGPIADRLAARVSARRSHVADAAGLLSDQRFQEFFTLPEYHDAQGRVRYDLGEGEFVELGGMLSGDRQSRTQPSNDPSLRVSDTRTVSFERLDLAYKKVLSDRSEIEVAPWYGHDEYGRFGNFGAVPTSLTTESHLAGFRSEWRGRVAEPVTARVGFDLEIVQSTTERRGSITSPPREGDAYVFGRPPADQVNADVWKTTIASAAPYSEVDWAPFGEKLHLTPGRSVRAAFDDSRW